MHKTDVWPIVHAERHALAVDLEQLAPDQWATPSLCADWDVHDVLAHLVATAKITPLRFLAHVAAARFDFARFTANGVAAERAVDSGATLAGCRAVQSRTTSPPADRWAR